MDDDYLEDQETKPKITPTILSNLVIHPKFIEDIQDNDDSLIQSRVED